MTREGRERKERRDEGGIRIGGRERRERGIREREKKKLIKERNKRNEEVSRGFNFNYTQLHSITDKIQLIPL